MLHAASPQSVTQLVSQALWQLVSHHIVVYSSLSLHSWSKQYTKLSDLLYTLLQQASLD